MRDTSRTILRPEPAVEELTREVWEWFLRLSDAQALVLALACGTVVVLSGRVFAKTGSSTAASLGAVALVVGVLAGARLFGL